MLPKRKSARCLIISNSDLRKDTSLNLTSPCNNLESTRPWNEVLIWDMQQVICTKLWSIPIFAKYRTKRTNTSFIHARKYEAFFYGCFSFRNPKNHKFIVTYFTQLPLSAFSYSKKFTGSEFSRERKSTVIRPIPKEWTAGKWSDTMQNWQKEKNKTRSTYMNGRWSITKM